MHQVTVSDFLTIVKPFVFEMTVITVLLVYLVYYIFYLLAGSFTKDLSPQWLAIKLRHDFALGATIGIIFTIMLIVGLSIVGWRVDTLLIFVTMAVLGFLGWLMSWKAVKEARQPERFY